jgi:hypothetical protein
MNTREAGIIAARIWDTGRAVRSLGECIMGPVRPDGTFAGVYRGRDWRSVVNRAMSSKPYDTIPATLEQIRSK